MMSQDKQTTLSALCAILLCATILSTVLFSGSKGGNVFNYFVTALFVAIAVSTALLEKKPFRFTPEIILLMLWLCYSLLPSLGALDTELAFERMRLMLQIIIIVSLSVNVMIWYGQTAIFTLVFFASAVLAYVASLTGFGFGVIDDTVLQEANSAARIVGTHGNANQFGMLCLAAQLAAVLFGVQTENAYGRLATGLAVAVLGIAIIHTGSRTALVGMIFLILGLVWVFRVWRFRYMARSMLMIAILGIIGTGSYLAVGENNAIRTRIDSYLGNDYLMERYNRTLRLFSNVADSEAFSAEMDTSDQLRVQLMQDAWNAAIEAPLGIGLDNFRAVSASYAHSNYFELLATTGFFGLALYTAIYIFMLGRLLTFARHRGGTTVLIRVIAISVVTLMITDIANVSYADKHNWLFLALVIASIEQCRRTTSSQPVTIRQSRVFAYSAR